MKQILAFGTLMIICAMLGAFLRFNRSRTGKRRAVMCCEHCGKVWTTTILDRDYVEVPRGTR